MIDDISDPGAWQRAIDRGCLANADYDAPLHDPQQGSAQSEGDGAGESGFHADRNNLKAER
jgi:hypothetical protein